MKDIIAATMISIMFVALLWAMYRKGQSEERYKWVFTCPDCGDEKHAHEPLCRDCQRKLNGEMIR